MAKKKNHGHVNHERYIITYADLITLLLAFFIIMYALSENNPEKMKAFSQALTIAFNPSAAQLADVQLNGTAGKGDEKRSAVTKEEQKMMQSVSEQNNLRKTKEKIDTKISEEGLQASVKTILNHDGLRIILTDEILFESGSANFRQPINLELLDYVSYLLGEIPNPVAIEGHTDNVPIRTNQYPSNWELSAARSMTVLKHMVNANDSLIPERFSSTGYGEYKPIAENTTSEGRKTNRRVEILVKRMNGDGLMVPNQGGGKSE